MEPCDLLMAKKKNWFDRLKRFFSSETKSKQEKKERRKRWVFGRFKSKCAPALPGPSSMYAKSLREAEEVQTKHALAVAVATAAAAEAAVAAAQAAAEVVRLTGTPLSYHKTRELAATIIQTAFRGYLARKALQALRGLVRLQALIRGQVVRRQTTITLKGLQSLMKIQSEARATRVRMTADSMACEDKTIVHGKIKKSGDMRTTLQQNSERKWDGSTLSKEEINALLKSRVEAALKRERAMEYAFSRQERMNWRSPTTAAKGTDILNQRWSWLDQWVGAQPLNKDVPENSPVPSPDQNLHDQQLQAPHSLVLLDAVHHGKAEETEVKYFARRSFNQSRRTLLRDDDSFTSSPSFPSYMASTASTKARFRSMSTPKQRLGVTDACSDYGTPFTNRLLSPFPSIGSEGRSSKTGKSLTFHHKSPGLRGQRAPVKSHRPSNYRSFDSRCSLLNWDHYSVFR